MPDYKATVYVRATLVTSFGVHVPPKFDGNDAAEDAKERVKAEINAGDLSGFDFTTQSDIVDVEVDHLPPGTMETASDHVSEEVVG